jgi:hypothetical protein
MATLTIRLPDDKHITDVTWNVDHESLAARQAGQPRA